MVESRRVRGLTTAGARTSLLLKTPSFCMLFTPWRIRPERGRYKAARFLSLLFPVRASRWFSRSEAQNPGDAGAMRFPDSEAGRGNVPESGTATDAGLSTMPLQFSLLPGPESP